MPTDWYYILKLGDTDHIVNQITILQVTFLRKTAANIQNKMRHPENSYGTDRHNFLSLSTTTVEQEFDCVTLALTPIALYISKRNENIAISSVCVCVCVHI